MPARTSASSGRELRLAIVTGGNRGIGYRLSLASVGRASLAVVLYMTRCAQSLLAGAPLWKGCGGREVSAL